jgi:ribosomal protein L19E
MMSNNESENNIRKMMQNEDDGIRILRNLMQDMQDDDDDDDDEYKDLYKPCRNNLHL